MVWLFDCFQRVGQRCTPCTQSRIIPAAPTAAITWLTVNTRSANSGTALTIHGEFCFLRGVDTLKSHLRINIRSEFSDNEENSCQNWKRLLGPAIPENFGPNFRWVRTVIQVFFLVLPRHVLWLVQETRAILSTNQKTNPEPSAPGHSYFPALQAVCLCGPWSPIGYLWHFFLDSDCSVFITNAIQDHFRLSVEKCSIPRARILSISCQSKIVYGKRIQFELKITESWQFFLPATNWSLRDYFRTPAEISENFWFFFKCL